MATKTTHAADGKKPAVNGHASETNEGQAIMHQRSAEIQKFGDMVDLPIGLEEKKRKESVEVLNGILADSVFLHALYKKYHWLARGATFYQLHLLLDKQAEEQSKLVDALAERIQKLGGIAVGDPRHAAELTSIPRPPDGAEEIPAMLSRLLEAHETTIEKIREGIEKPDENDDAGTSDLLSSKVLPTHETHVWYVAEHLVPTPLVQAHGTN